MTSDKQTEAIEQVDEQAEQIDDEQVEEETDDQEEQQTQEQADLQAKIDDVDAKIEQYRINAVEARKVQAMKKHNYSDEQIEKYVRFVEGDTADEIDRSVLQLSQDITPSIYYGDPSPLNGAKAKPKTVDKKQVGRNAVKRILSKIRL